MAERRKLTAGLAEDPDVQDFLRPQRTTATPLSTPTVEVATHHFSASGFGVINVRVSTETTAALDRASFDRKQRGEDPSSKAKIVEEAVRAWLRAHGYLR